MLGDEPRRLEEACSDGAAADEHVQDDPGVRGPVSRFGDADAEVRRLAVFHGVQALPPVPLQCLG